jgi:hypothetical protein
MRRADINVKVLSGSPVVYRRLDHPSTNSGCVWILWATSDTGDAKVEVPVIRERIKIVTIDGTKMDVTSNDRTVQIFLKGDTKMAPPVLLIDRY